jgi:site-specific DNA-adenine methylase
LRPFFSYYGGKWRDALKLYPEPKHDTIVEPFAGSAGYALRYSGKKVILCEVDPTIAEIWLYLKKVSSAEIMGLADVPSDGSVDDLKACDEAKWLVGLWLNRAVTSPRKRPSKWMRDGIRPGSFWGQRVRLTIAKQLPYIRHWKIFNCSYEDCPDIESATWFVDPPYQAAGQFYRYGSKLIDYEKLATWCKARSGQVIVCENAGADWLPFRHLANVKTTRAKRLSKEVYWVNRD